MRLSILIVNFNGLQHLAECLDSIAAQCNEDMEVVLVDNASQDGSREWLRTKHPWVKLVESEANLGFAGGNNLGIPHCQGDWVFLLNNDTVLEPECLRQLLHAMEHDLADAIQCLMLDYRNPTLVDDAGDTFFTTGLPSTKRGMRADSPSLQTVRPIFCACAGAAAWKRSVLEHLHCFDERFFLNYEDSDLSMRARHQGFRIALLPQARIRHKGSATLGRYTRTSVYYSVRNLGWMKLRNYPWQVIFLHFPATLCVAFLSMLKYFRKGAGLWWLEARRDQLFALPRILSERKAILASSTLDWREFNGWLERGWLRHMLQRH